VCCSPTFCATAGSVSADRRAGSRVVVVIRLNSQLVEKSPEGKKRGRVIPRFLVSLALFCVSLLDISQLNGPPACRRLNNDTWDFVLNMGPFESLGPYLSQP
jgi:hypothetical protein